MAGGAAAREQRVAARLCRCLPRLAPPLLAGVQACARHSVGGARRVGGWLPQRSRQLQPLLSRAPAGRPHALLQTAAPPPYPACSKHPLASVRQTAEALHDAAKSFKRKTGARPAGCWHPACQALPSALKHHQLTHPALPSIALHCPPHPPLEQAARMRWSSIAPTGCAGGRRASACCTRCATMPGTGRRWAAPPSVPAGCGMPATRAKAGSQRLRTPPDTPPSPAQRICCGALHLLLRAAQEGSISVVFVAASWDTVSLLVGEAALLLAGARCRVCGGAAAPHVAAWMSEPPAPEPPAGDHPAQSRAGPPLRVPDITQAEALQYLRELGVPEKHAEQARTPVGLAAARCAAF